MSQRVKRPNRSDDGSVPIKRRKRPAAAPQEEEEAASVASWRPINDLKIYNRTTTEAPAELFRKDLISAMKLPDSEPLASDEYWVIVDQWKQEWERGVQVPVNPDSLPEPSVTVTHCAPINNKPIQEFKTPKTKYIRITKDDNFKPDEHLLSTAPAQSEAACSYDLDECDVAWLKIVNNERLTAGLGPISEDQFERVVERLELRCWEKIQAILRNEEGLGIEYDENVICDVCRSPDSEEGNEMVFCDSCNICVHQACYGITRIPEGQWLCCTCTISQRPECVLCPNKGGAMKCTRSGQKWAHVSCALWIPEVSIGCVEKMEPITKISSIPQSRWALICVLCRERVGACIQCSVKTCKTAYHVTCAFKHGLEMRAIIEDENADDGVKLRSYCEKHSKSSKKEKSICSGSEDDDCKRKKRKDMTSEEKNQARAIRSQEIEAEFYKHVNAKDIAVHIEVDSEALQCIYSYWKLKRKAGHNKPLLPPKSEDIDMLSHKQEQADLDKMKMFVQLRQDLERVRNLCYMVSRREKLSRSFFRMREQTFHKQAAVLQDSSTSLAQTVIHAVIEANHGPSIYDRLYSSGSAEDHSNNFEAILARIAGIKSPPHDSSDEKKPEVNGLFKDVKNNPYKKIYFNGSSKRRSESLYGSLSSASSSDEKPKDNKENRLHSSSEDEKPFNKKKTSPIKSTNCKVTDRRKKRHSITRSKLDSSSEDDIKPSKKDWPLTTSRLKQMEHELGVSASDSDELMPIKSSSQPVKKAMSSIYSDSDSSDVSMKNDDKSSNAASDTQSQSKLRTKAAVKEFCNKPSTSKSPNKSSPENKKKTKEEPVKKEKEIKKKDYVPSDLIVPQRQAAKKATENIKSNTSGRANKEQSIAAPAPAEPEPKVTAKEDKEKPEKVSKPRAKVGRPPKEHKEHREPKEHKEVKEHKEHKEEPKPKEEKNKKENKKEDVFDIDKEMEKTEQDILAYVPQRQAAKKAAEHIKSGLGKPVPVEIVTEDKNKKEPIEEKSKKEVPKKEPEVKQKEEKESKAAKVSDTKRKSTSNSSTSSSSSSSSDTSSSSSSDSEDDRPAKQPQSESSFSPREPTKRTGSKDWPFLDKGAKSAASTSSSDSSDSSRPPSPQPKSTEQKELPRPPKQAVHKAPDKPSRKSADKKQPAPPEREEPAFQPREEPTVRPREEPIVRSREQPAVRSREQQPTVRSREQPTVRTREQPTVRSREHPAVRPREEPTIRTNEEPAVRTKEEPAIRSKEEPAVRSKEEPAVKSKEEPAVRSKVEPAVKSREEQAVKSREEPAVKPREEQAVKSRGKGRASRGRPRSSNAGDRVRDANVRSGDIVECRPVERDRSGDKPRKGKPDKPEKVEAEQKETRKSIDKLLSPVKQPEKPVEEANKEPEIIDLEKEILERKVASNKVPNCKVEKEKVNKSPVKVTKSPVKTLEVTVKPSPVKKSPVKMKSIEDIFANKLSNTIEHKSEKKINSNILEETHPEESNIINVETYKPEIESKHEEIIKTSPVMRFNQNRSMFSPNPKDMDLLADFNNMLNDGFGISKDEEIVKGPLTFSIGNSVLFKEDSKEDSARETLNLVEKLRMGLSKKSTGYDIDDSVSVASSTKNDNDRLDFTEQIVPNNIIDMTAKEEINKGPQINLEMRVQVTDVKFEEPKDYGKFLNCDSNMPLDVAKNVPEIQHQHLDVAAPADERWVPPSDGYPNLQAIDPKVFNEHIPESYMPPYESHVAQIDNRLRDDSLKSDSPSVLDRRVTQTPFLDPASMDCMPSPVPYNDMHPQAKWADSEVMPTRRSSSSSAASTGSNGSRRNDVDDEMLKRQEMMMINHPPIDQMPFGTMPFPPNSLDPYPPYSESNPFVGTPVSLFPSANINTQIPFPSPGAAMFPPAYGASFPTTHSVIPPLPKPMDDAMLFSPTACTAAFTSSQHNMALTAAMVNLPPVLPMEPKPEEKPVEPAPPPVIVPAEEVPPSPATPNHVEPSPNPSLKSNSSAGKKSPSKPTRTSARFISQQTKSPSKSPGKSPRQELKTSSGRGRDGKKGSAKGNSRGGSQSQPRGRGRGRGRGRPSHSHHDYDYAHTNTIHNKLIGTVYDLDFDDDMPNEMGDLRTMRERRKSADVHERKMEALHASRDSSESPKFTSPNNRSRTYNTDLSELRPPTPINETHSKPASPEPEPLVEEPKTFPTIVQPVLPGPVDMRTYNNTFDSQQYNDNLLGAFSSGVTEQPVPEEFDESYEKELQSALAAKPKPQLPEVSNIKVSLSDSRNQLKVKIKGPFSNNTSTLAPLPPVFDTTASNLPSNAVSNSTVVNTGVNSGTSTNLRRMRKKELLHQYCSQDIYMDDQTTTPGFTSAAVMPSINRTTITIPKAVASMTSIPTKEDYRDYRTGADEIYETKIRKEKPPRPSLSRELRQLDITLDDDQSLERRRSVGSNNSNSGFSSSFDNSASNKRRGRPPRPTQTAPKLKIKISGNSIVGGSKVIDDKKDRIRPPKKRLSAAVVKPSVEDLKRESMKFRKQVMADFTEEKKEKKKKDKKSKKKKKQEVQIIANEATNTPKLIIRFGKKTEPERTSDVQVEKCNDVKKDVDHVSNKDSERTEGGSVCASSMSLRLVRTNKVTPIKLKLSRCQEGSGYVMKTPPPPDEDKSSPPPPLSLNLPEPPTSVHKATTLPLNKDCEVR